MHEIDAKRPEKDTGTKAREDQSQYARSVALWICRQVRHAAVYILIATGCYVLSSTGRK